MARKRRAKPPHVPKKTARMSNRVSLRLTVPGIRSVLFGRRETRWLKQVVDLLSQPTLEQQRSRVENEGEGIAQDEKPLMLRSLLKKIRQQACHRESTNSRNPRRK
jgi:hypothetical protein